MMPCYTANAGGVRAIVCGRLGKHCAHCHGVAGFACDYPVGGARTCDEPLCDNHAVEVARNRHVCPAHERALRDEPFELRG